MRHDDRLFAFAKLVMRAADGHNLNPSGFEAFENRFAVPLPIGTIHHGRMRNINAYWAVTEYHRDRAKAQRNLPLQSPLKQP